MNPLSYTKYHGCLSLTQISNCRTNLAPSPSRLLHTQSRGMRKDLRPHPDQDSARLHSHEGVKPLASLPIRMLSGDGRGLVKRVYSSRVTHMRFEIDSIETQYPKDNTDVFPAEHVEYCGCATLKVTRRTRPRWPMKMHRCCVIFVRHYPLRKWTIGYGFSLHYA